ncbi:hypothetical protein [Alphaproteobacteria bacterium endosymbiont of Tiliacea citrago]|uniref:hypothetical protein n=1 Tax=Alphaproteobacteria bacterium endosymbiont of Tiliacea citrago TaxID=3077944 RepID=UPI00313CF4ED
MDIKSLIKKSMINWSEAEENLINDFNNILELIGSLPEPKNQEIKYENFAPLFKDEENKVAKKEDIIEEGDMFVI